ncbi:hypothetical protein E2C01_028233 [Portunus trituberculatus]|uniref:Uncharacterized protein n=1 Tax=Portunus trituberculatus TaxID=210409 RepID=A0A5B7EJX9_PORTR|nr:hypothetical protein [Portunus trituberculatus]
MSSRNYSSLYAGDRKPKSAGHISRCTAAYTENINTRQENIEQSVASKLRVLSSIKTNSHHLSSRVHELFCVFPAAPPRPARSRLPHSHPDPPRSIPPRSLPQE